MIVTFTFSRRIGYYLINFYVPCIIMVIMSWIVFWMDRDCIGDRIALGITTVLTIVFLLGSSNSTMPRVSYPKAIDWYLMTSFIFVFTTLIMCLLIFRFDRQLGKQQRPPRSVSGEPPAEAISMQVLGSLHDPVQNYTYRDASCTVGLLKQTCFALFWNSHCANCFRAGVILYHVTRGACKGPLIETFISSCCRDKITRLTAVYILLCLVTTKLSSKDTLGARICETRVEILSPLLGRKRAPDLWHS